MLYSCDNIGTTYANKTITETDYSNKTITETYSDYDQQPMDVLLTEV